MSTDPAAREPDTGHVRRWFEAIGFNLILLVGAALPAGMAVPVLWAGTTPEAGEGAVIVVAGTAGAIALACAFFILPALAMGIVYVPVLVTIAWCSPGQARRIAFGGSACVVVASMLFSRDLSRSTVPFWCGLMTCMAVFAAWMHVDSEAPPSGAARLAAILPTLLLIVVLWLADVVT